MPIELPSFHDAVLLAVTLDFDAGSAELRIGMVGDPGELVLIRCDSFRRVVADQDEPWGPSGFIMGIAGGDERLDVEVQSGDHVLVYGPDMKITVVREPPAAP